MKLKKLISASDLRLACFPCHLPHSLWAMIENPIVRTHQTIFKGSSIVLRVPLQNKNMEWIKTTLDGRITLGKEDHFTLISTPTKIVALTIKFLK